MLMTGAMRAQKQFDCYRVQEFMFNSATQAYDKPSERADFSKFVFDEVAMLLTQQYTDGTSSATPIKAVTGKVQGFASYEVISPANGYHYIYRIKPDANVIEVSLVQNNKETLLKKYLFRS